MRTPTSTRTCKQDAQTLQGIPMTHCMHVSSSSSYMTHVPMRCRYTYMRTHTRTYMQGGGQRAGEKENHATTGITQRERERERERERGREGEGGRETDLGASFQSSNLPQQPPTLPSVGRTALLESIHHNLLLIRAPCLLVPSRRLSPHSLHLYIYNTYIYYIIL